MENTFEIRPATKEDIPILFSFINQLAEHHNSTCELAATEDLLEENLFGKTPGAEVLIGILNGIPVAYALFVHNFSTLLSKRGLYLVDLFVIPEARHKGIGKRILIHLARLAKERNCARFEWSVQIKNLTAIDFYENLGAEAMNNWKTYRMTGEALDKLALG